jgi:hypothetical protein
MLSHRRIAVLVGSLAFAAALAACSGDPAGPAADCYYNSAQGNSGAMWGNGYHNCINPTQQNDGNTSQ